MDYAILFPFLILLFGVGLAALASASSDISQSEFGNPYYYLKDQLIFGIGIGTIGFFLGYLINYRIYKKFAAIIFVASIVLLLLVMTPLGAASGGAQRWIIIGPLTIQPSEILKLTIIVYLAAWLSESRGEREKSFSEGLLPFLMILAPICLLLLFQKSTSAAAIIGVVSVIVYMASGAKWRFAFLLGIAGATLLTLFVLSTPYRLERIKSFIDPSADSQGASYQVNQALTVIGSGRWTGVGYGESTAKNFLPEGMTDSIFAIIAEEFGFIVAILIILLFFTLVTRGLIIARGMKDKFGKLLLTGISSLIGIQAFIHIASSSALIPTTGVPLPFVSYGNFSLAISMTMVGIMLSVDKNG